MNVIDALDLVPPVKFTETELAIKLRNVMDFIADEYRDPSQEPNGDWISLEARPVWDDLVDIYIDIQTRANILKRL